MDPGITPDYLVRDQREVSRQRRRVDLQLAAESVVRTHDRILKEWRAWAQDQQVDTAAEAPGPAAGAKAPGFPGVPDADDRAIAPESPRPSPEALEEHLVDAFDIAQRDRVDPRTLASTSTS